MKVFLKIEYYFYNFTVVKGTVKTWHLVRKKIMNNNFKILPNTTKKYISLQCYSSNRPKASTISRQRKSSKTKNIQTILRIVRIVRWMKVRKVGGL